MQCSRQKSRKGGSLTWTPAKCSAPASYPADLCVYEVALWVCAAGTSAVLLAVTVCAHAAGVADPVRGVRVSVAAAAVGVLLLLWLLEGPWEVLPHHFEALSRTPSGWWLKCVCWGGGGGSGGKQTGCCRVSGADRGSKIQVMQCIEAFLARC